MRQQDLETENLIAVVGRSIRKYRRGCGWPLKQLAKASGVSVGHLSTVERGECCPSLRTLVGISRALGVPLTELFREFVGERS